MEDRSDPLVSLAERYAKLVLRVGQHDADFVDAYHGHPAWRPSGPPAPLRALAAGREFGRLLSSPGF